MTQQSSSQVNAKITDIVELLRPAQWVKNVVVFAAPAAGLKLLEVGSFLRAAAAFAGFCLAASACYAINDVVDREADRLHPTKRQRPVARGAIEPGAAIGIGIGLLLAGVGLTFGLLRAQSTLVLVLYFFLTLTYSLVLKQVILLDVIVIATGFVLRAWAGAVAVNVPTSAWLAACMFTLCMFMGFGKRRCELAMMGATDDAARHRQTLDRYTP
ncbi:MAG: UbiA prenyltransferase family protein [Planctomycetota bacterium]